MAHKFYLGKSNAAREVKHLYVGVNGSSPVYGYQNKTVNTQINWGNYPEFFSGTNPYERSAISFSSTSGTYTATKNMTITINWKIYCSHSNTNDDVYVYLKVGSTYVINYRQSSDYNKSGTWTGVIKLGESISIDIHYDNDGSKSGTFSISAKYERLEYVQTGVSTGLKARRVRKAYIGKNGVAKPFFSDLRTVVYGGRTNTPLRMSNSKSLNGNYFGLINNVAGASVGNYAIFAGGDKGQSNEYDYTDDVNAYDSSLTAQNIAQLSFSNPIDKWRSGMLSGVINNKAVFAGGYYLYKPLFGKAKIIRCDEAISYDTSLTQTQLTDLSSAKCNCATANTTNHLIFAGWVNNTNSNTTDAYDNSLTRSTITALGTARYYIAGASIGEYAIFAGGKDDSTSYSLVECYDAALTKHTLENLSAIRTNFQGASFAGYAVFGGGTTATPYIDRYNASLTRDTTIALSSSRSNTATGTLGSGMDKRLIFAGGDNKSTVVDVFDASFTRTSYSLSVGRTKATIVSVGNYALVAGGGSLYVEYFELKNQS
jgi:hypothetical protein